MPKRKVISESEKTATKKLKAEGNTKKSRFSFDSPEQCFLSLISPISIKDFFEKYWEKEPLFISKKDAEYYAGLPTKDRLEEIVKKEQLEYNEDIFLTLSWQNDVADVEGQATVDSLMKHFQEKAATLLLDKPHQYDDELFNMLQLLESYFGCCVTCELEVAPKQIKTRLLSYSGQECFILQVEGKRKWGFFKPLQQLANSGPVDPLEESEFGQATHEYQLEPGDLLYIPRGTVFREGLITGEFSSHIHIGLYDQNSWGNFLSRIVGKAVADAMENDVSFREGLPLNFLSYMGYGKKDHSSDLVTSEETIESSGKGKAVVPKVAKNIVEKQNLFQEKLKKMLASLAQYVDPHWGTDAFGKLFMANRLPPLKKSGDSDGAGNETESDQAPGDESVVQMKFPEYVRITFHEPLDNLELDGDQGDNEDDEDDGSEEEDEENTKDENNNIKEKDKDGKAKRVDLKSKCKGTKAKEEEKEECEKDQEMEEELSCELDDSLNEQSCIAVQHSLHNDLENIGTQESYCPDTLKFPVHYRDALLILHRSMTPVAVKDLPLNSEERVELAVTLWSEGLLAEVKESKSS